MLAAAPATRTVAGGIALLRAIALKAPFPFRVREYDAPPFLLSLALCRYNLWLKAAQFRTRRLVYAEAAAEAALATSS